MVEILDVFSLTTNVGESIFAGALQYDVWYIPAGACVRENGSGRFLSQPGTLSV